MWNFFFCRNHKTMPKKTLTTRGSEGPEAKGKKSRASDGSCAALLRKGLYADCVLVFGDVEIPSHLELLREWCGHFRALEVLSTPAEQLLPLAPGAEAAEPAQKKPRLSAEEDAKGKAMFVPEYTEAGLPRHVVVKERHEKIEPEDWHKIVHAFVDWLYDYRRTKDPVIPKEDLRARAIAYAFANALGVSGERSKYLLDTADIRLSLSLAKLTRTGSPWFDKNGSCCLEAWSRGDRIAELRMCEGKELVYHYLTRQIENDFKLGRPKDEVKLGTDEKKNCLYFRMPDGTRYETRHLRIDPWLQSWNVAAAYARVAMHCLFGIRGEDSSFVA